MSVEGMSRSERFGLMAAIHILASIVGKTVSPVVMGISQREQDGA